MDLETCVIVGIYLIILCIGLVILLSLLSILAQALHRVAKTFHNIVATFITAVPWLVALCPVCVFLSWIALWKWLPDRYIRLDVGWKRLRCELLHYEEQGSGSLEAVRGLCIHGITYDRRQDDSGDCAGGRPYTDTEKSRALHDNGTGNHNGIMKSLRERMAGLELALTKARAEITRNHHIMRKGEDVTKQQSLEIDSLKQQLSHFRHSNNNNSIGGGSDSLKKTATMQSDIERLQRENEDLKAESVILSAQNLKQNQRAMRLQNQEEELSHKIVMLKDSLRNAREELEGVRRQLQLQTRRADEQRESRIRLQAENDELQREVEDLRQQKHIYEVDARFWGFGPIVDANTSTRNVRRTAAG
jgi:hypothetical protein